MPEQNKECYLHWEQEVTSRNMFLIIIFLTTFIIALDYFATKRLVHQSRYYHWWISAALAADILPITISLGVMMLAKDNSTTVMITSAWAFFTYLITCVSRVPFNISVISSDKRWARIVGLITTATIIGVLFHGMIVTRTDYKVNEVTIYSSRLPKAFDGYRIVQISDIHIGTMLSPEKELTQIVDLCNKADADIIAICGDLVNVKYDELTPQFATILSRLKAHDGVYSVTGNHDTGIYMRSKKPLSTEENIANLLAIQQKMGWITLEDRSEYIYRGADSIVITGVAFSEKLQDFRHSFELPYIDLKEAYAGCNPDDFNITISHIPQAWDSILQDSLSDLTLSGHVHAMQFKLPIGKRGISPAMFGYKRWSGLYEEQKRYLYINDGIGNVLFPLRVGARPEITVITLRCSE